MIKNIPASIGASKLGTQLRMMAECIMELPKKFGRMWLLIGFLFLILFAMPVVFLLQAPPSNAEFLKIQPGMTQQEVESILGVRLVDRLADSNPPQKLKIWSDRDADVTILVAFTKDGKVLAATYSRAGPRDWLRRSLKKIFP